MRYLFSLLLTFFITIQYTVAQTTSYDLTECMSTQKLISVYSGKGTVMLPGCFTLASAEMIAEKFPGNKPDLVYTVSDIALDITVSFTMKDWPTTKEDLPKMKDSFIKVFEKKGGKDIRSGILTVNGKEFIYYECTTIREGYDDMYNWVFMSDLDGHFITATFNCLDVFREKWQAMGKEILSSLKIK